MSDEINLSWKKLQKRMQQIIDVGRKGVDIGVLQNSHGVSRKGKIAKLGAAQLAALHANGALVPTRDGKGFAFIPPRDYMTKALREHEEEYKSILQKAIRNDINPANVFTVLGQKAVAHQKLAIREMEPRNAPSTIARKGKDSPLQDTGNLYKSIKSRTVDNV